MGLAGWDNHNKDYALIECMAEHKTQGNPESGPWPETSELQT